MLSAFLHPSPRKPKSGLKSIIHGGRTMHRAQHLLDMDAQYSCTDLGFVAYCYVTDYLCLTPPPLLFSAVSYQC